MMKSFALTALVLIMIAGGSTDSHAQNQALPLPWIATTETYTTTGQVRIWANAPINLITGTSVGDASPPRGPQVPNVWNRVDLKQWGVAADAKWATLGGILIITPGTPAVGCYLTVTFRAPGDTATDPIKYIGQSSTVDNGSRSTLTVTVPLVNGEFDWSFYRSTGGVQPGNASYGINMVVQAWGR